MQHGSLNDHFTVAAVYEVVNESEWSSTVPSLHERKEGWLSDEKNIAKHPVTAKPGWLSDTNNKENHPGCVFLVASQNFLITQPPLLAVMQGGDCVELHSDLFTTDRP